MRNAKRVAANAADPGISRLVTTTKAALICGKSEGVVRRHLTPAAVEQTQVFRRGTRTTYRYDIRDVEDLRDGRPLTPRQHPDPRALSELRAKAARGGATRAQGVAAALTAVRMTVTVPADMPTCCQRHARNCVRHEGSDYDALIDGLRSDAGYAAVRDVLDDKVDDAIGDLMPEADHCGGPNPHQR